MKKIKEFTKQLITNRTVLFIFYLFVIEVLFKILTNTFSVSYSLVRIFISSCFLACFLNALFRLIKYPKLQKICYIFFVLLIGIYALAQLGFNNFLGNYASLNTSSQLGKVTSYIMDYLHSFKGTYYLILIPTVLLIIYIILQKENEPLLKNRSLALLTILFAGLYIPTLTLGFMQEKFQYISNRVLFENPTLPNVAVNQFGINMFGLLDIKSKLTSQTTDMSTNAPEVNYERVVDDAKMKEIMASETDTTMNSLNQYFYSRKITEKNDYTGMFEGKNLILIMLESVNNVMVNEEYFPTLYKLYNEGLTFTNNYSPRNNCSTGNNEFSALTSLYTINNVCSANVYKDNTYFESLFHLFTNQGYQTSSYHNYTEKYYYRSTIHKNLGSTYFGVDDLDIPWESAYKEWPSDVELVEKAWEKINHNEPYMALFTTVTTHQPYGVSSTYGDKYLERFEDLDVSISVKRYLSKMTELDLALERLLDLLEESGELDNTVIAMFGDHYPYGIKTSELQELFDYDLEQNKEIERTPFIIYNHATAGKKLDSYTTYMNITPTLANLFNLEYDPRLYLGEDLFSKDYSDIAIFADGSWQSRYAYYDAEKSKIFYTQRSFEYSDEEIMNINREINEKISMSNLAIVKNYFHYLDSKLNSLEDGVDADDQTSSVTTNSSS